MEGQPELYELAPDRTVMEKAKQALRQNRAKPAPAPQPQRVQFAQPQMEGVAQLNHLQQQHYSQLHNPGFAAHHQAQAQHNMYQSQASYPMNMNHTQAQAADMRNLHQMHQGYNLPPRIQQQVGSPYLDHPASTADSYKDALAMMLERQSVSTTAALHADVEYIRQLELFNQLQRSNGVSLPPPQPQVPRSRIGGDLGELLNQQRMNNRPPLPPQAFGSTRVGEMGELYDSHSSTLGASQRSGGPRGGAASIHSGGSMSNGSGASVRSDLSHLSDTHISALEKIFSAASRNTNSLGSTAATTSAILQSENRKNNSSSSRSCSDSLIDHLDNMTLPSMSIGSISDFGNSRRQLSRGCSDSQIDHPDNMTLPSISIGSISDFGTSRRLSQDPKSPRSRASARGSGLFGSSVRDTIMEGTEGAFGRAMELSSFSVGSTLGVPFTERDHAGHQSGVVLMDEGLTAALVDREIQSRHEAAAVLQSLSADNSRASSSRSSNSNEAERKRKRQSLSSYYRQMKAAEN